MPANLKLFSGLFFDPAQPDPSLVHIGDIAHSLSNLCRFGGHCQPFYSVAQHSVEVKRRLQRAGQTPHVQLWGLLHDAPEAYSGFGDIVGPLKPYWVSAIEGGIMRDAICPAFGLGWRMPSLVKVADREAVALEARELMGAEDRELRERWNLQPPPADAVLPSPLSAIEAHGLFLREFEDLATQMGTEVLGAAHV